MSFTRVLFDPGYAAEVGEERGYDRLVSRHGRPALVLSDDPKSPYFGLAAYESERGALLVMETLGVFRGLPTTAPMLLPTGYMRACLRAPDGDLVALHDDPDAIWSWRPLLYTLPTFDDRGTQRLGSQQEQEYRVGVAQARCASEDLAADFFDTMNELAARIEARHGSLVPTDEMDDDERAEYLEMLVTLRERAAHPPTLDLIAARERADALLLEHLAPQQRLDLASKGGFYVRGELNRLYFVEVGNGFQAVDPVTHDPTVAFCLHPEAWIPHADVALAIKLGIDGGKDSEAELLGAANPRPVAGRTKALPVEVAAWEREEHYRVYP